MGFFNKKNDDHYEEYISLLKTQIEDLKKEKKTLLDMVQQAYLALTSKETPGYYADTKREETMTPIQQERSRKLDLEKKFMTEYMYESENGDYIKTPEDLKNMFMQEAADDLVSKVAVSSMDAAKSIHNNEES